MLATVLIDNNTRDGLLSQWGLSFLIEYNGKKILLDTGANNKFLTNAETMEIDIKDVQLAVLSHAHYDHANGMTAFFSANDNAKFYLQRSALENCYAKKFIFSRYIGIKKGTLKKYKSRIVHTDGIYSLLPGVWLLPHTAKNLEAKGKALGMYTKEGKKWLPDSFSHEQSLVLDTEKGIVVFNSCCHGGADNIIKEVFAAFPQKKIYALIGGLHLYNAPEAEIERMAKSIKETGIEKVYTDHCTGERAIKIMAPILGDRLEQFYTGMKICI